LAPNYPIAQRCLVNALAQLDRLEEARAALDAFLVLAPDYAAEKARRAIPFRDDADFDHYMAGLRLAGWEG
jgi:hypothetical protein